MNIIILNGTCGSGKSTVTQYLVENYSFYSFSCDNIIKQEKAKTGISYEYNSESIYSKYSDLLSTNLDKEYLIIDSIFIDNDLSRFLLYVPKSITNIFHIVLYPQYEIAYMHTQERTCFIHKTEEYWVKYFHKHISELINVDKNVHIIDNSYISIQETANIVLDHINYKKPNTLNSNSII